MKYISIFIYPVEQLRNIWNSLFIGLSVSIQLGRIWLYATDNKAQIDLNNQGGKLVDVSHRPKIGWAYICFGSAKNTKIKTLVSAHFFALLSTISFYVSSFLWSQDGWQPLLEQLLPCSWPLPSAPILLSGVELTFSKSPAVCEWCGPSENQELKEGRGSHGWWEAIW